MAEYAELDFTGRFGRYNEVLGSGAFKTVYRAFDEVKGIEVAWNQVKIYNNLEHLCSEVQILRRLKHENIIRIYGSWVDRDHHNLKFITEIFRPGTLREFRERHKHIRIQVIKKWARQILRGLQYLHTQDPPIVHRDLKCNNIFIDGSQGDVKIGDFGLAAVLPSGHRLHDFAGTLGFVAPEVYEGNYDELADIYSFGRCVLELVTVEYSYTECAEFVKRCLSLPESRPTASQLLLDPFLQCEEEQDSDMHESFTITPLPIMIKPAGGSYVHVKQARITRANAECHGVEPCTTSPKEEKLLRSSNFGAKGEKKDNDTLSLTLRLGIAHNEGRIRQRLFPDVLDVDTAMAVATEVIEEHDDMDEFEEDLAAIAEIIEAEVRELVEEWEPICRSLDSSVDSGQTPTPDEGLEEGSLDPENSMEVAEYDEIKLFGCVLKVCGTEMQNTYADHCLQYAIYT